MSQQIQMDLSAFAVITGSVMSNKPAWSKIAKLEQTTSSDTSLLLTQFGGLTDAQLAYQKRMIEERRSIRDCLIAYVVGILILICFLRRPLWHAVLRLLSRVDVARIERKRAYVPVRRRFFPSY